MEVQEYTSRRWLRITLNDGDSLKESIREVASRNDIDFGWLQVLGELEDSSLASGYESSPGEEKIMIETEGSHHVLGVGSVTAGESDAEVHLHGPVGRNGETVTGCWAGEQSVFRGIEILLVELTEAG